MYGNLSITTATSEINETVESMSRFLTTNRNIELLEPYEGKLSRTVLRGERGSNALDLPDTTECLQLVKQTVYKIHSLVLFLIDNLGIHLCHFHIGMAEQLRDGI